LFPLGQTTITWTATDDAGNRATATQKVTVRDTTAPALTAPPDIVVPAAGPGGTPVNLGTPIVSDICDASPSVLNDAPALFPVGVTVVTWTAEDVSGNGSTAAQRVTVTAAADLVAPQVTGLNVAPNPVAINTAFTITALADDSTTGGSNIVSAQYRLDQGTWTPMAVSDGAFDGPTEDVRATVASLPAGVYEVFARATDAAGNVGEAVSVLLAVYDPSGGFVTGGGWITSPTGAYSPDPNLTGRASFGFVSKYKKGASLPTGETEFQFKIANFNFHSDLYEWLVIAGAKAQYKGTGTVNGAGEHGFMLTAVDGQIKGGLDKFRIKIWDKATGTMVYDNQMGAGDTGDPTTVIGGGSIVIHK
jgi:hypothetical protein